VERVDVVERGALSRPDALVFDLAGPPLAVGPDRLGVETDALGVGDDLPETAVVVVEGELAGPVDARVRVHVPGCLAVDGRVSAATLQQYAVHVEQERLVHPNGRLWRLAVENRFGGRRLWTGPDRLRRRPGPAVRVYAPNYAVTFQVVPEE